MVYSRPLLLWAAILFCSAQAEPLGARVNGTNRVLPNPSLAPQDVTSSSTTTLPSSSELSSSSLSSPTSQTSAPSIATISSNIALGGLPIPLSSPFSQLSSSALSNVSSQEPITTSISTSSLLISTSRTPRLSEHHNATSTNAHSSAHHNASTHLRSPTSGPYYNITKTTITTTGPTTSSTSCVPYTPGEIITVWSIVPNTNTVTLTLYPNQTNTYTTTPEWIPPTTCLPYPKSVGTNSLTVPLLVPPSPTGTSVGVGPPWSLSIKPAQTVTSAAAESFTSITPALIITTAIISSKNPVTQFTTQTNPPFPAVGVGGKTQKESVPLETSTPLPSAPIGGGSEASSPTFVNIGGGGGPPNIVESSGGGVFMQQPTPTLVDGVSVALGNTVAVVGGSTYAIGAGASEQTIDVNSQKISIGPGGIGFADVTLTPAASLPTNVVVYDGQVFSVVGASVAVFDGISFTFTGGVPQTTVFNGDTITAGPSGFVDGTQTLGGPNNPTGTQFGLAGGLTISEIGSTEAVIDGTTLTIGPSASRTTATIDGHTITAAPAGLTIGGSNGGSTTLNFPFNPSTQAVTAGGITFSEIGPSLVNIGGTTFTIGPGASATTDVYNGQTISVGPGGIGFATTTITSFTTSSPTATSTKKKNAGLAVRPGFGVFGVGIALGVVFLL